VESDGTWLCRYVREWSDFFDFDVGEVQSTNDSDTPPNSQVRKQGQDQQPGMAPPAVQLQTVTQAPVDGAADLPDQQSDGATPPLLQPMPSVESQTINQAALVGAAVAIWMSRVVSFHEIMSLFTAGGRP
jgi:hypothetical protein